MKPSPLYIPRTDRPRGPLLDPGIDALLTSALSWKKKKSKDTQKKKTRSEATGPRGSGHVHAWQGRIRTSILIHVRHESRHIWRANKRNRRKRRALWHVPFPNGECSIFDENCRKTPASEVSFLLFCYFLLSPFSSWLRKGTSNFFSYTYSTEL